MFAHRRLCFPYKDCFFPLTPLAAHDHRDRPVPCFFVVRRAARCLFLLLALLQAELFSALATT